MLHCELCEYSHSTMIHSKHVKEHGLTVQEYKARFPAARLRIQTEESKAKMSASKLGKPSKLKGVPKTAEHAQNLSKSIRESYSSGKTIHWNTGNTTALEVRQKIASANRDAVNLGNVKQRLKKQDRIAAGAALFDCVVLSHCENKTSAKCTVCQHEFIFTDQVFYESRLDKTGKLCPVCQPRTTFSSAGEREVLDFIKSVYAGTVIPNDRSVLGGKELDIYLPELKLAFEYTGLYWHAEKQNPIKKHLLWKRDSAFNNGVQLITIFEDEWKNKSNIVKSRIMNMLGAPQVKLAARKLQLGYPSVKSKNLFLDQNHLQGKDTSSECVALMQGEEIMCIATFKKTNIVKGGDGTQWELSRFASKLNVQVQGGAGKLISWFKKNHVGDLISYADTRWSTGKLYKTLGFTFVHRSEPSYWYMDKHYDRRVHRSAYMKHRLVVTADDRALTEWELAQRAGLDRIWDCGTTKWVLS